MRYKNVYELWWERCLETGDLIAPTYVRRGGSELGSWAESAVRVASPDLTRACFLGVAAMGRVLNRVKSSDMNKAMSSYLPGVNVQRLVKLYVPDERKFEAPEPFEYGGHEWEPLSIDQASANPMASVRLIPSLAECRELAEQSRNVDDIDTDLPFTPPHLRDLWRRILQRGALPFDIPWAPRVLNQWVESMQTVSLSNWARTGITPDEVRMLCPAAEFGMAVKPNSQQGIRFPTLAATRASSKAAGWYE